MLTLGSLVSSMTCTAIAGSEGSVGHARIYSSSLVSIGTIS